MSTSLLQTFENTRENLKANMTNIDIIQSSVIF